LVIVDCSSADQCIIVGVECYELSSLKTKRFEYFADRMPREGVSDTRPIYFELSTGGGSITAGSITDMNTGKAGESGGGDCQASRQNYQLNYFLHQDSFPKANPEVRKNPALGCFSLISL
jgi:hypothetical protein